MKPGSFLAVLYSLAATHYCRMRLLYWLGIPALLGIGIAMRVIVGPIHLDFVHDSWQRSSFFEMRAMRAGMYETYFSYAWAAFSAAFFFTAVIPIWGRATSVSFGPFTYPQNALSLPVKTAMLVLGPLIWGTLIPVLVWVAFDKIDWIPHGPFRFMFVMPSHCPSYLPALGFIAAAACANFSRWATSLNSWVGILISFFAGLIVMIFIQLPGSQLTMRNFNYGLLTPFFLGVIVVAAIGALWVAPRARYASASSRKAELLFPEPEMKPVPSATLDVPKWQVPAPVLRSPAEAQIWILDHQLKGKALFAILTGIYLFIVFAANIGTWGPDVSLGIGDIQVGAFSQLGLFLLVVVTVLSSRLGGLAWFASMVPRSSGAFPDRQLFSALPVTSLWLTKMAALSAWRKFCLACAASAIGLLVWLLFPAHENGRAGRIGGLLLDHLTVHGLSVGLLVGLSFLVAAWGLSLNTPMSYPWRPRFTRYLPFAAMYGILYLFLIWFALPVTFAHKPTLNNNPPGPDGTLTVVLLQLVKLTPAIAAAMVARCAFLWIGVHKVLADRLIPSRAMLTGFGIWIAGVLCFGTAYSLLLPGLLPTLVYFLYVAALLPLNRLIWPVLTIDAARHA